MPSIHNLHLSTLSNLNAPQNKTNMSNVHWNIDWSSLFHGIKGECQVYVKLKSKKFISGDMNLHIGTLRANFSAPNSNNTNGVVLAITEVNEDPVDPASDYFFIENEQGITIHIPEFTSDFSLSFMDMTETLYIENIPEYEVLLTFVVDN